MALWSFAPDLLKIDYFVVVGSKRKADDEADWELQERCKSRCIWMTGQKGLTELEAAVMIIHEAKKLISDDLLQMGVEWKPQGIRSSIIL